MGPRNIHLRISTYTTPLFERFYAAGADLTSDHELAGTLAYHTSNRPLFGFAKRHRLTDPKIQMELNIALAQHVDEENLKGVHLCLWAGADPHAPPRISARRTGSRRRTRTTRSASSGGRQWSAP